MLTYLVILTAFAVVVIIILVTIFAFRSEEKAEAMLAESIATGANLPPSLHPVIDTETCIGSAACVDLCPESVLGRVKGVTHLIQANDCIGHGRCQDSCPVDAIALVFGTAERGVDIPLLRKGYETNVDGLMIVGELGGMGLIKNAMAQGERVVATVPKVLDRTGVERGASEDGVVDVVIVGAGPAGIAVALECTHRKMSFVLLEQYSVGGSVTHYPRRKLIFTETIKLPIVGKFGKSEMLKEELVAEFERVLLAANIEVREHCRVVGMEGSVGAFRVKVQEDGGEEEIVCGRTVVLAIGRRGTPRHLGVPGEELPHVVYRLLDPEQYRHRKVLIVGGGDSAIESAVACSMAAGCEVYHSYRGDKIFRIKKKNRAEYEKALSKGRLTAYLQTNVVRIARDSVVLRHDDGSEQTLAINDVIINAGGVLPTAFLESVGVAVETKFGEVAKSQRIKRMSQRSKRFGSGSQSS